MSGVELAGRCLGGIGLFLLWTFGFVLAAEGPGAWKPFLNLDAAGIVLAGTFVMVWQAYPLRTVLRLRDGRMLAYASRCAVSMGFIGALVGLILLLSSVADVAELPRRFALVLDAPLFSLILSSFVLQPLAERARAEPDGAGQGTPAAALPRGESAGPAAD